MPVEFLTDDEAGAYGRYSNVASRAELEKLFFLDDEDRALVGRRREPLAAILLADPRGEMY